MHRFMGDGEWRDPQWAPPSAQSSQGRDTLGAARLKEGELKSQCEGGVGAGVEERGPAINMGQIRPQLADFIHPSPPTLPIHSSISQPSPRNNTPARCALMNSTFAPIPQSCLRRRKQSRHAGKAGRCVRTAMLNTSGTKERNDFSTCASGSCASSVTCQHVNVPAV